MCHASFVFWPTMVWTALLCHTHPALIEWTYEIMAKIKSIISPLVVSLKYLVMMTQKELTSSGSVCSSVWLLIARVPFVRWINHTVDTRFCFLDVEHCKVPGGRSFDYQNFLFCSHLRAVYHWNPIVQSQVGCQSSTWSSEVGPRLFLQSITSHQHTLFENGIPFFESWV